MPTPSPADDRSPADPRTGASRTGLRRPGFPSVLDLVRLSPDPVFPPGGEQLYREIALLTGLEPGQEVLVAACGRGTTTAFLVEHYGVDGAGIDSDAALVQEAEQLVREKGIESRAHFQSGPLDDLPYQDGSFDVTIGEIGLAASVHPAHAVRELARVTRPMGSVVLVQLIWTGNMPLERREVLVQHLGARPMLLVEWKQFLRDAGVVDLHVEDWSDQSSPFRPGPATAFHDLAEIFTLRQKLSILRAALRRWGWRGVRGAVVREQEIHRLLTRKRVLGLSMIRGTRWTGDI